MAREAAAIASLNVLEGNKWGSLWPSTVMTRRSHCDLTTCYSLLATDSSLLATYSSLLTTHYSLLTTRYLLSTTYYLLPTTYHLTRNTSYFMLHTPYSILHTSHFMLRLMWPERAAKSTAFACWWYTTHDEIRIRKNGTLHHPPAYCPVVLRAMHVSAVRHMTRPPIHRDPYVIIAETACG